MRFYCFCTYIERVKELKLHKHVVLDLEFHAHFNFVFVCGCLSQFMQPLFSFFESLVHPFFKIVPKLQERYKEFHGRLPIIVAETLLRADPNIELPLWLVQLFKVILWTENCSQHWRSLMQEYLLVLKIGLSRVSTNIWFLYINLSICRISRVLFQLLLPYKFKGYLFHYDTVTDIVCVAYDRRVKRKGCGG